MNLSLKARIDRIEPSEVKGIRTYHFSVYDEKVSIVGELPDRLVDEKMKKGDEVIFLISDEDVSLSDLSQFGSPITVFEGVLFKKSTLETEGAIKYWISVYGLQFRISSEKDLLPNVRKIQIAICKTPPRD